MREDRYAKTCRAFSAWTLPVMRTLCPLSDALDSTLIRATHVSAVQSSIGAIGNLQVVLFVTLPSSPRVVLSSATRIAAKKDRPYSLRSVAPESSVESKNRLVRHGHVSPLLFVSRS